jgi:teichuronic acid biosynthesis glycosyltransferase TuaC
MKILFVSSGNSKVGISPIIQNQGDSLIREGVELEYFTIKGKDVKGYLKSIFTLREYLKNNSYDIVHAHYSLSAIVASLAGAEPLVVSLMGSDVKANNWFKWIIYFFNYFSWSSVIVKSEDMHLSLGIRKALIIPNGINMNKFIPIDKNIAREKINWNKSKKHILFAADPNRKEKNFLLTKMAFEMISDTNIELHYLKNVPNNMMPYYYNAADVVMLTSLWEGSPNAIKEAMACNIPIVSTDVGDVKNIIGNTSGCFITENTKEDVSIKIMKAISCAKPTLGRKNINDLNDVTVAKNIINIYSRNII